MLGRNRHFINTPKHVTTQVKEFLRSEIYITPRARSRLMQSTVYTLPMSSDQIKRCFVLGNYLSGVGRLERLHVVMMTNLKVTEVEGLWATPDSSSFTEVVVSFETDCSPVTSPE